MGFINWKNFSSWNLNGFQLVFVDSHCFPLAVTKWLSENLTGTNWKLHLESNGNFQLGCASDDSVEKKSMVSVMELAWSCAVFIGLHGAVPCS